MDCGTVFVLGVMRQISDGLPFQFPGMGVDFFLMLFVLVFTTDQTSGVDMCCFLFLVVQISTPFIFILEWVR